MSFRTRDLMVDVLPRPMLLSGCENSGKPPEPGCKPSCPKGSQCQNSGGGGRYTGRHDALPALRRQLRETLGAQV